MGKWKSKYGKARWIDTRLSKWWRIRRSVAHIQAAQIGVSGHIQLAAIKSQCAADALQKLAKSLAIANAQLQTMQAVADTLKQAEKGRANP